MGYARARGAIFAALMLLAAAAARAADDAPGGWVHAYAAYGEPKYARGFSHFEYVNPDAPRGGTLFLKNPDRRTSFDKFNEFTVKGQSPAGVMIFMMETLCVMAGDELSTMYGLLAEEMRVAPDKSSITFRLHPNARFNNGDPVTAADVKHSFDMLTSKHARPLERTRLAGTQAAVVLDPRTIRFDLKERSNDALFNLGTRLAVFSRKWGAGPDGKAKPFDEVVNDHPISSGPYRIARAEDGRRLELVRDPEYWGRALGARRGFFNFDRIVYRFYQDNAIAMEAFKAGEFDLIQEYSARRWVRQHAGAKWRDGRILKQPFENGFGQGLQSFQLNSRRPLFQDVRVREAVGLTYDFDNGSNSYKQYRRTHSIFANSEFAARGMPDTRELELLEPFRAQLPAAVFGPAWEPPRTASGPDVRRNLLRARALLEQAGWKLGPDGVLRNAQGEPFEFEYTVTGAPPSRAEAIWQRNLEKLGIRMKTRLVDFAIFLKRLETFDFDMVLIKIQDFALPKVADLKDQYGSRSADIIGSNNYRGIRNPAADALVERMDQARTLEELLAASHALDRVIVHNHYQVPDLFSGRFPVSYWDKFGMPAKRPRYFTIDSGLDVWPAWVVTTWWFKDAAPARTAQAR
jgi:peptide/nickel transport system substrate-binding protein/microcin C transport system substrate-binding protein